MLPPVSDLAARREKMSSLGDEVPILPQIAAK
jgi:hypothetical protein